MSVDYSLYLLTDRSILKNIDLLTAVEEALQGGVSLVQLREKDISSREFYQLASELKQLLHSYQVPLIINDRLDIALAVDADGLHIGQDDLPIDIARRLLGPDKILGYSVSSIEEARYGQSQGANYLGAGSVYPTGSKTDAGTPIGVKKLKEIKASVSIPVVGIGGIGAENIAEVRKTGVDGTAMISAILGSTHIKETCQNILREWRKL